MFSRIRKLLRDPVYRRERRHAFFGKRWLGPGARAATVGIAYGAFITAWVVGGEDWVDWARWVGNIVAFLVIGLTTYAAPGAVGAAVASEFDNHTAEALFLTPLSRNHIVFAKLFARLTGLFELYVWVLPIFLLTPRPELIGALIGLDLTLLANWIPGLGEAQLPIPPLSVTSVLLGFKNWVQAVTGLYYAGALGLASAMFARSGKLAIVLSYVGVLFIAGTVIGAPVIVVIAATVFGTVWLAANGMHGLALLLDLSVTILIMEILVSLVIPTVALRLCARRINAHLDAGQ